MANDKTNVTEKPAVDTIAENIPAVSTFVYVKDLESEYHVSGRFIRIVLRRKGLHAKKIKTSFGARRLYRWKNDSEDLAKIRRWIVSAIEDSAEEEDDEEDE